MLRNRITIVLFGMTFAFVLICIIAVPLGFMGATSLTDSRAFSPEARYVGLSNYYHVLASAGFTRALRNTFIYAIGSTLGQTVVGTIMALCVQRSARRRNAILVALFFVPYVVVPSVVTAFIWRFLGDSRVGLIPRLTGIPLFEPGYLQFTLIAVSIWVFAPFVMLLVVGRLRQIPPALYESVTLSQGSSWHAFRWVTLPQILPTIQILFVLRLVFMATKFDLPYLLLGSGSAASEYGPAAVFIYQTTYEQGEHGFGCAAAILLALLLFIPAVFMARRARRVFA